MGNKALWNQYEGWKKDDKWVDLTRELSVDTPHWSGFPDMVLEVPFDYPDGFFVHKYTLVSQYGTHIDAPCHFPQGRRSLDQIMPEEMVLPLCVIDITDKVNENVDYVFGVQDILDWEAKYGKIPEGAFVAMQTGWSKREDMNNFDENGIKHFPGWGIPALEFLVHERRVKAVGH
ncbi:MAG: cyclase family protein, partial [Anaerotignum sp.]|nr:cyclase family protein [Anaerotignum sp.]